MILLVDNRDSFCFNLAQELGRLGAEVLVRPARGLTVGEVAAATPAGIVLGPGPGAPERARLSLDLVRTFAGRTPLLGVCLGHQAIAVALGGRCERSPDPVHGRAVEVVHDGRGVFEGLASPARMARYNSLTVDAASLPDELVVSARTPAGEVMGLRHVRYALEGVQFHPESIESQDGARVLANFVELVRRENPVFEPASLDVLDPHSLEPSRLEVDDA